jgi:hypothetical protein
MMNLLVSIISSSLLKYPVKGIIQATDAGWIQPPLVTAESVWYVYGDLAIRDISLSKEAPKQNLLEVEIFCNNFPLLFFMCSVWRFIYMYYIYLCIYKHMCCGHEWIVVAVHPLFYSYINSFILLLYEYSY